ncbi:PREDICTED: glutamine-rich protein 1-like [Amphimedon queenslandica]|uniref:ZMYM2-like/QRICH1 C-terminal domain-containing protein n=1 Tax=Amphimedon queenslandica TaxID=400682 RepID=A0A1X7U1S6_AMPQE|nr:PREDICTED: glutamine-rich protein 1-like [Amphimedon queenslandica]|eukprot:XP_019856464.1 PREDICTED: glutamine-rich protein 1-like [Amphimedon queenslandica]
MKRLTAKGLGAILKKAECIEIDEEETLWSKGILGDHSPSSLLNTIFYMNGLYFALRSGKEHRQLRYSPCQIKIIEKERQIPYLEFSEEISKNNPGGLKGRKITPKVVKHYANLEKPHHCFVRIFKKYNRLCPENRPSDAFYLKPMSKPREDCWFTPVAVGHNTLRQMTKTMFKMGEIKGVKTNHSLQTTAATRL